VIGKRRVKEDTLANQASGITNHSSRITQQKSRTRLGRMRLWN